MVRRKVVSLANLAQILAGDYMQTPDIALAPLTILDFQANSISFLDIYTLGRCWCGAGSGGEQERYSLCRAVTLGGSFTTKWSAAADRPELFHDITTAATRPISPEESSRAGWNGR